MENLLKFKVVRLSRFNNSEYSNFMRRVEDRIKETGMEVLGLTADFLTSFSKNLRLMDDIVVQSRVDAETKELGNLDIQRDSLWKYIYTLVEASSKLEISCAEQVAGVALLEQIKPYKGLEKLPNMQETQQIRSLIVDLQKPHNVPRVENLHISFFVSELNKINEAYATLTATRADARIETKMSDSKQVRSLIDTQYQYMTDMVFAKNVSTPSVVLAKFITQTNQIIEEANIAYHQRMSPAKKPDTSA